MRRSILILLVLGTLAFTSSYFISPLSRPLSSSASSEQEAGDLTSVREKAQILESEATTDKGSIDDSSKDSGLSDVSDLSPYSLLTASDIVKAVATTKDPSYHDLEFAILAAMTCVQSERFSRDSLKEFHETHLVALRTHLESSFCKFGWESQELDIVRAKHRAILENPDNQDEFGTLADLMIDSTLSTSQAARYANELLAAETASKASGMALALLLNPPQHFPGLEHRPPVTGQRVFQMANLFVAETFCQREPVRCRAGSPETMQACIDQLNCNYAWDFRTIARHATTPQEWEHMTLIVQALQRIKDGG